MFMPTFVNIHEAKTHFSRLISRVANGEEIIIAKAGNPVARLLSIKKENKKRISGSAKNKIIIREDFDLPLPEHIIDSFNK